MNAPERDSSKSGPELDDVRKKEVEGQVRSGHPTRAEEWHDPEPPVDAPPYGGKRRDRLTKPAERAARAEGTLVEGEEGEQPR